MNANHGRRRTRVVRVAVTGHRPNRMPEAQWRRIKADLDRVMAEIEAQNPAARAVLLSGLAEGADRLAAFVALGRGWDLHAVLAFDRTRFEQDFPDAFLVGEFRALCKAATTVEEPKATARKRPPEHGYHRVGQRLLALSDVLIAVWDGEGSRGKGGTVEVIEDARARNIPVIWVHAKKPRPPQHLTTGTVRRQRSRVGAATPSPRGTSG